MSGHEDDADCGRCGKPVHLQHDPPCPHGEVACPECGHVSVCRDCAHNAELEERMHAEGHAPHDLANPVTRAEVIARTTARAYRDAYTLAQLKCTYDEAQARYIAWTQERGKP
jgi:uncharacterized Zn finger protein (UPF0148 family)